MEKKKIVIEKPFVKETWNTPKIIIININLTKASVGGDSDFVSSGGTGNS